MTMRKTRLFVLSLAALVLMSAGAHAQDVKGKTFFNAGVGIGTFGLNGSGGVPVVVSVEHGFTNAISAGVVAGFVNTKIRQDYRYGYYLVGAKGSYHFNELLKLNNEQLDVYGGLSLYYLGYRATYKGFDGTTEYKATGGGVDFGIHAGARYMFAGNVGAFAELGYGLSPLQLGLSITF